jgi:hypothetical protein
MRLRHPYLPARQPAATAARAGASAPTVVGNVGARSDGARQQHEAKPASSSAMPAAPKPPASSAARSQGRGGADNDGFHTRSDQSQTACAKAHAFLSRDELEVAPGAALAYR